MTRVAASKHLPLRTRRDTKERFVDCEFGVVIDEREQRSMKYNLATILSLVAAGCCVIVLMIGNPGVTTGWLLVAALMASLIVANLNRKSD